MATTATQAISASKAGISDISTQITNAVNAALGNSRANQQFIQNAAQAAGAHVTTSSANQIGRVAQVIVGAATTSYQVSQNAQIQVNNAYRNASLGQSLPQVTVTRIVPTYTNGLITGYSQSSTRVATTDVATIQRENDRILQQFAIDSAKRSNQLVDNVANNAKQYTTTTSGLGGGTAPSSVAVPTSKDDPNKPLIEAIRDLANAAGSNVAVSRELIDNNTAAMAGVIEAVGAIANIFNPNANAQFLATLSRIARDNDDTNRSIIDFARDTFNQSKALINGVLNNGGAVVDTAIGASGNILDDLGDRVDTAVDIALDASQAATLALAEKLVELFKDAILEFADIFGIRLDLWAKEMQATFTDGIGLIGKLLKGEYININDFYNEFEQAGGNSGLMRFAFGLITFIPVFTNLFVRLGQPQAEKIIQLANASALQTLIDPDGLIQAMFRGVISYNDLVDQMKLHGISPQRTDIAVSSSHNLINENEIRQLFLRGFITENQHKDMLRSHGYKESDIQKIEKLYEVLPSVNDLIVMSQREVFTPDIAQRFGLFEDLPQDYLRHAEKVGLNQEWARAYWGAHWMLPSPQQGFEMFQRSIISRDDLRLLLRALDIMPFWRDKLINLSYRTLARVDVRRMYVLGVLDRQGVKDAYLKEGYSPSDAELMTEFTVRYEANQKTDEEEEVSKLTRAVIIKAYDRGAIDGIRARNELKEIGYSDEHANFLIHLADYDKFIDMTPDRTKDHIQKTIKLVSEGYLKRFIPRSDAIETLVSIGYTQQEAINEIGFLDQHFNMIERSEISEKIRELYFENAYNDVEIVDMLIGNGFTINEANSFVQQYSKLKNIRTGKPTKAELFRFLQNGVIDFITYVNELRGMGYDDKYVGWYIGEAAIKLGIEGITGNV